MPTPDELLSSVLRAEQPRWPWRQDDDAASEALLAAAEFHGVQALAHSQLHTRDWPAAIQQRLREAATRHAMWELGHHELLARTLAGLHSAGIQPVLIKGTALAYSLYSNPALRTRSDTDLIIPPLQKQQAHDALLALGYERSASTSGDFISYQASYRRTGAAGAHSLDLHWKINNSQVLSRLFTHEELLASAVPLPALCDGALGPSRAHSLLIACMHRSTHKHNPYHVGGVPVYEANRMIWLYDIHLLAESLAGHEWQAVAQLAREKGLRAVCLDGLKQAHLRLHTRLSDAVLASLSPPQPSEVPWQYLDSGKWRQLWMDMRALAGMRDRARYLRELLVPPAEYMYGRFSPSRTGWLPWLYLRRAALGLIKRLRS